MRRILIIFLALLSFYVTTAQASPTISLLNTKYSNHSVSLEKITQIVKNNFDISQYRDVKVQVIFNHKKQLDHLIVVLLSKKYHGFKIARVNIDYQYNILSIQNAYHLTAEDIAQQPGISAKEAKCPDASIEFIAFAPNNMDFEQKITIDVAKAAESHALKTIRLLKQDATRNNYINYMSCPNLKGNFYDGDSDPEEILVADGFITANDIKELLANKFRFKVTNIWLACEAFNDPMKSAVIDIAQAQKYAAGLNDLLIGPSDIAADCAMKAAINHLPMKASFDVCYKLFDQPSDHWGYGGNGSDYFGV